MERRSNRSQPSSRDEGEEPVTRENCALGRLRGETRTKRAERASDWRHSIKNSYNCWRRRGREYTGGVQSRYGRSRASYEPGIHTPPGRTRNIKLTPVGKATGSPAYVLRCRTRPCERARGLKFTSEGCTRRPARSGAAEEILQKQEVTIPSGLPTVLRHNRNAPRGHRSTDILLRASFFYEFNVQGTKKMDILKKNCADSSC